MVRLSQLLVCLFVVVGCVEDRGMLPGVCGPIVIPFEVIPEPQIDREVVDAAVAMWNEATVLPFFVIVEERWEECRDEGCLAAALVVVNTPLNEDALADTALDIRNEQVRSCLISLHPTWGIQVHILAHELGHCLGLDDDPDSLDLASIMSSPTYPQYRPTESDVRLVIGGCNDS